jgi:hypothetical protein
MCESKFYSFVRNFRWFFHFSCLNLYVYTVIWRSSPIWKLKVVISIESFFFSWNGSFFFQSFQRPFFDDMNISSEGEQSSSADKDLFDFTVSKWVVDSDRLFLIVFLSPQSVIFVNSWYVSFLWGNNRLKIGFLWNFDWSFHNLIVDKSPGI